MTIPTLSMGSRYHLLSQLGVGGMGVIYKAYDRLRNEVVALKHIHSTNGNVLSDGTLASMALASEFRVLAGLRHPHIVSVLDYGFSESRTPFYTMQLLENAEPITVATQQADAVARVQAVIEMLQALVYLHRRGIIHRDLKPTNVLVTTDGMTKVLDFGLALQRNPNDPNEVLMTTHGTLAYMSPELFSGGTASVASDLYAVGVILYEIFTGRHPFDTRALRAFVEQLLNSQPDVSALPSSIAPIVGRLMHKEAAERYPTAESVIAALCHAVGIPIPAETAPLRDSLLQANLFVGRNAELETLKIALYDMLHQEASVWLVAGESGVGKSRLLDELRPHALINGTLVARGQAIAEGGLPFQLWRDAMRPLVLDTPLSDLEASVLKTIVPDIDGLLGREVADPPELTGKAGQNRLIFTIVDVLKRQTRPTLLLLEDLHWADESLLPLQHLLGMIDQISNILVLATYRDDEAPDLPNQLKGAKVLRVGRLDAGAVALLSTSMLGAGGGHPALVALLQRETEGNAFFMVETVRALAEDAGSLLTIGAGELPTSVLAGGVQQLIKRRLAHIPAAYEPILKQVAVAGRWLDLDVLHRLIDPSQLASFLQIGAAASILDVVDDEWRFSHDKLREVVLMGLSPDERRTYNATIAAAIEAAHPDDLAYAEVLLEQWRAAGNTERELHYAIPVSAMLRERPGRAKDAWTILQRGLSLLEEDDPRRAAFYNALGFGYKWEAEYVAAAEHYQRGLAIAQQTDQQREVAVALNGLGSVAEREGDFKTAIAYFEQALTIARTIDDKKAIAANLNELGIITQEQADYAASQRYHQEGMAINRELKDLNGQLKSVNGLGIIAAQTGNFTNAETYFLQVIVLAEAIGHVRLAATGRVNLAMLRSFMGEPAEAVIKLYDEAIQLSKDINDLLGLCDTLSMLATVLINTGLLERAEAANSEALELARRIHFQVGVCNALLNVGKIRRKQGDYVAAEMHFNEATALASDIGYGVVVNLGKAELADTYFEARSVNFGVAVQDSLREALAAGMEEVISANLGLIAKLYQMVKDGVQAITLATIALNHPATGQQHHADLRATIEAAAMDMNTDAITAAIQRAESLDLLTVAQGLLDAPLDELSQRVMRSATPPNRQPALTRPNADVNAIVERLIRAATHHLAEANYATTLLFASMAYGLVKQTDTLPDDLTETLAALIEGVETTLAVSEVQAVLERTVAQPVPDLIHAADAALMGE